MRCSLIGLTQTISLVTQPFSSATFTGRDLDSETIGNLKPIEIVTDSISGSVVR